ncbi:MAG: ferrous iron transporter B [Clostridia bacterium]|nr:ferrous iron transporter B [Clostridia bacterium]
MEMRIALTGNPNSGKTTLFNALTGSNQSRGNWPGVHPEKKEGRLKNHPGVTILELPGIDSLSSGTPEERVVETCLLEEKPDAILNIVDGTDLQKNLFLTTQLLELGIPTVVAVSRMDVVGKNGERIDIRKLSRALGVPVVEVSALTGAGVMEAAEAAVKVAQDRMVPSPQIASKNAEALLPKLVSDSCVRESDGALSTSVKIDRVVTDRRLALPIFIVVMFLVYVLSVSTVGVRATDWTANGVFGDGWRLFHIGTSEYNSAMDLYASNTVFTDGVTATVKGAADAGVPGAEAVLDAVQTGSYRAFNVAYRLHGSALTEAGYDISATVDEAMAAEAVPNPADFGIWVSGIPVMVENWLDSLNTAEWLKGLLLDGILGGVGAVLSFVPQMLLLFFLLALLESCGYMARAALLLDRLFRRFGLSGKSFLPILIGVGCAIPGAEAARSIKNERTRRLTLLTGAFIPCGARLPLISMIAVALFRGAWWVGPAAYFLGMAAIIISAVMLKKTQPFAGEPAPLNGRLPAWRFPPLGTVLRIMWKRCAAFIGKAGTVIFLASIFVWLGSVLGRGGFDLHLALEDSVLGMAAGGLKWLFAPLGFDDIRATVATLMGLLAKEEIIGVFGVLDFARLTPLAGASFLAFNLLASPCLAATDAIRRETGSVKWTAFAVACQCGFAYCVALMIYQLGLAAAGMAHPFGIIAALAILGLMVFQLVRPYQKGETK